MKNTTLTPELILQMFAEIGEQQRAFTKSFDAAIEKERQERAAMSAKYAEELNQLHRKIAKEEADRKAMIALKEKEEAKKRAIREKEEAKKRALQEKEEAKKRALQEEELARRLAEKAELDKIHEARMKKMDDESKRAWRQIERNVGKITDTMARFAEFQVRPAALRLFKELGVPITQVGFGHKRVDETNQAIYEVDILLYNGQFIVAIEVKSTLRINDIDEHIERIEKMREFPLRGTAGTKIIGAVAAMNASEEVVTYAARQGFYVILPNGSAVSPTNNASFVPRYWEIA